MEAREHRSWRPHSRSRWVGPARFAGHYLEMCLPMCIGFALGDLVYFSVAGAFGYSHPFEQASELSVAVVTLTMTAPMVAWMAYRRMPRRETLEMAAVMPTLAVALLVLGWLGALPRSHLALTEHGLMMPAMLFPCCSATRPTPTDITAHEGP
jgi:hypothetical protein